MTQTNSQTLAATIVGAAIGGLAGYLFFTDRGRALRRQIEPAIDNITGELNSLRSTVRKASTAAAVGWTLLNEAVGDARQPARYTATHQTTPF